MRTDSSDSSFGVKARGVRTRGMKARGVKARSVEARGVETRGMHKACLTEPAIIAAPTDARTRVLLIACGALVREARMLIEQPGMDSAYTLTCLPAQLHFRPELIAPRLDACLRKAKASQRYDSIRVLYGDCGSRGDIDKVLQAHSIERIEGPDCYAMFAGAETLQTWLEQEPGSFFLTDFLARHFDSLVVKGLGLDRFPQLRDSYFGNYTRLIYIAQVENPDLVKRAQRAAAFLQLRYEYFFTGLGALEAWMKTTPRRAPTHPAETL